MLHLAVTKVTGAADEAKVGTATSVGEQHIENQYNGKTFSILLRGIMNEP